eukprot:1630859-Prymnesium_polylepis.1
MPAGDKEQCQFTPRPGHHAGCDKAGLTVAAGASGASALGVVADEAPNDGEAAKSAGSHGANVPGSARGASCPASSTMPSAAAQSTAQPREQCRKHECAPVAPWLACSAEQRRRHRRAHAISQAHGWSGCAGREQSTPE